MTHSHISLSKRVARGFSLVELMVAMALSLLLMAGVLSIFFSSKVTYIANEHTARLQENGRIALDLVVRDLRSSGYPGCLKSSPSSPYFSTLNSPTALLWNFSLPLQGFENTGTSAWTPAVGVALVPAPLDGSDIIAIRAVDRDARALVVQGDMASGTAAITVPNTVPAPVTPGQVMMLSDCFGTGVFQVTSYAAGNIDHAVSAGPPGNATDNLGYGFRAGSRVVPVQTTLYYVATGADGGPALWRQVGAAAPQELIQGVQSLQVAYGLDTDADRIVNQYVAADAVGNWENIIGVSVSLLMQSDQAGTELDTATYSLLTNNVGGVTVGPFNDRRQRMIFTTTAAIRNRAL